MKKADTGGLEEAVAGAEINLRSGRWSDKFQQTAASGR